MKNLFKYSLAILIGISMLSCERDLTFDGPSIEDQYGPFRLVEDIAVNRTQVDFSAGQTAFFTASFNKNVNWELRITGRSSGATKLITGISNELDETNASWDGGASVPPLFRAEACDVELLVPSEDSLLLTTTIETLSGKSFDNITNWVDFETDLGDNFFFGNFEFEFTDKTGVTEDGMAAQGEKYYFLEGASVNNPGFFVGLIRFFDIQAGANNYFSVPDDDPSNIYFNTLLWHDRTPHTIAVIQFFIDSNDDGEYTDGIDGTVQLSGDYPLDHDGWRLYSNTFEEIGISADDMKKIVGIQVLLISNENTQPSPPENVRFGIDFLTLTQGQPIDL